MKFTKVLIENFLTIQKAEIDLADRGLLLIQGDNKDDSSANSNGAGKSSIADAICWALYGVTARDVSGDAVVNRTAKKECRVELQFADDKNEWRVVRHRKHSTEKNTTLVQQKDANPACIPIDLHKGTERETQEVIDALIGCSLDVFQAAIYAGQEKMPDLPAMTDKHLKLMIEEAAGVEVLARAYEIARERHTVVKNRIAAIEAAKGTAIAAHVNSAAKLVDQEAWFANFEAQRKPLAKAELAKTLTLDKQVKELELQIDTEKAIDRSKELTEIETKFLALESEKREMQRLDKEVTRLEKELTLHEANARTAKALAERAKSALTELDSKVGKPCDECGKPYCEHDLDSVRILRRKDFEGALEELKKVASELKDARARSETAHKLATDHRSSMTDVSAMAARQKLLLSEIENIKAMERDVADLKRQIAGYVNAAKQFTTRDNPYAASVKTLKETLSEALTAITRHEGELEVASKDMEILGDAMKVYGPAGVRAHILDTVTPYLNSRTSHYLSTLADGNIEAVWSTLTKSAKGDLKEKFSIDVKNDKGAESFAGLSGGEKRKVRLSTAMALQDLVASRATKPIELFIADEVDHALDASGLERLMTVLNDKAKERGTVIVISHSDLKDWIDDVITVTKGGGYGQVSGSTRKSR